MAGDKFGGMATDMIVNKVVDYIKSNLGDKVPGLVGELEEHIKGGNPGEAVNKLTALLSSGGKSDVLELVQKLGDDDKLKVVSEIVKKLKG